MKINNLKINGFGKFINKEINFNDNINIIYGLNESGKSTMQKFIPAVMFGFPKIKSNKNNSDFDKLYPWNGLEYSGKITYTLGNGEEYEVFRDFLKKNPIIYNKNKIDISSKYTIDKNKGNNFFEEQTGIDEKTFLDTAVVKQQNVKLDKSSQTNIIQKITNILASGDESVCYNTTLEKITKLQNEKIGSLRTSHKPINKVNNSILKLEEEQLSLRNSRFELDEITKEENEIQEQLEKLYLKLSLIKDMESYLESSKLHVAEVDFNKRLEEEYDEKINDLKSKIDIRSKQNIRLQKKKFTSNYILEIILLVCSIGVYLFFKNLFFVLPFIIFALVNFFYIVISKINNDNKIKQKLMQIDELQSKIDKEIEILKQSKKERQFETKIKSERLNLSILKNEEKLSEKYHGKIEENYIENVFSLDLEELSNIELSLLNEIDNLKINLHTLKIEKDNLQEKLKKFEILDSSLEKLSKEKDELDSLNNSFKLAIETLEEAYKEMKENVSPNLKNRLSKMVSKISNGKYTNVIFDDENGLCVELENGRYLNSENLSIGTIDEIYLSLRLSVLEEITSEKVPIILDEAFAYFDNERLENLLRFLIKEYGNNQIIIFTCTNREIDILNKLNCDSFKIIKL